MLDDNYETGRFTLDFSSKEAKSSFEEIINH